MAQVTVLIPTYNRGQFLHDSISSALNQTVKTSVLIYDDGSSDNSELVAQSFSTKRVKYLRSSENLGEPHARNVLLSSCETPYACWLDSDDLMASQRIEKQLSLLESEQADICWTGLQPFATGCGHGSELEWLPPRPAPDLDRWRREGREGLRDNTTNATAMFSKRAYTLKFDERLTLGGSDTLWAFSLLCLGLRCFSLNETLYFYRKHKSRITDLARQKYRLEKAAQQKIIERKLASVKKLYQNNSNF
jgi:glycosyltransferase involved in cell wall biosynthesis